MRFAVRAMLIRSLRPRLRHLQLYLERQLDEVGYRVLEAGNAQSAILGPDGREMVRAGGLEPPRGYPQRIFVPATAFAAPSLRAGAE